MSNQCEHGQLARVCERCEDKAEIERLRAERDELDGTVRLLSRAQTKLLSEVKKLRAEIERLREALTMVRPYVYGLDNIKRIDAALSGAHAEQPASHVLVPREPTEAMYEAGDTAFEGGYVREMWAAMIAAAQEQTP